MDMPDRLLASTGASAAAHLRGQVDLPDPAPGETLALHGHA